MNAINSNWTPAQAALMQKRANQVMTQRNQATGISNQQPIFSASKPIGQQATSQVVQNDPPQANAPQLTGQQQKIVQYYKDKITSAGQSGDYSQIKQIQQEANQACQQAGIPPEAMQ